MKYIDINKLLHRAFRSIGYDIISFNPTNHPLARIRQLMKIYDINLVLDVGANTGQFAQYLRQDIRYLKKIISFEPLSNAFCALKQNAKGDDLWSVKNYALGDKNETKEINIAQNLASSSFLNMLPLHIKAAPQAQYVGKELIEIKTLDSIFNDVFKEGENVYLKIDVQGYESKVIKGAESGLSYINTIQLEMSLAPLYQNELLLPEILSLMKDKGYSLVHIIPCFYDKKTGQLLQVDGIFHRI